MQIPEAEVRRIACSLHLLSLCGGPDKREGLDKCVRAWGAKCTVYDIEISPELDIVDEGRWQLVRTDLMNNVYDSTGSAAP